MLQRRGVGPGGFDLRTLRKARSLLADSVRRPPPLSDPPPVCSFPSSLGVPSPLPQQTLVEPRGSQAGISPGALPATPHHSPNLGFSVYFLIQMPAGGGGGGWGRLGGRWKGCVYLPSPALTFTPRGEKHLPPGQAGPESRHYGCLTECLTECACGVFLFAYKLHPLAPSL